MTADHRLVSDRFPRASKYHPEWVIASASGGANSLWLVEWLTTALDLRPGMKVLDLDCGCRTDAGDRRSRSRPSARVVDPGPLVPAFSGMVAPALGADRYHEH